jgi:siroheme synthase-like protein
VTQPADGASQGQRAPGYPVVLDLSGRNCLVVGGGPVAARRAEGLVSSGATVTVVAPRTVPAIDDNRLLEVVHRPYLRGEAARFHLVITATGIPAVDRAVIADATASRVLVASADQASPGSVRLPAVRRDGPVTVAVSTDGASPALARWIGDRIAAAVPTKVGVVAALLDEARRSLRRSGRSTESVDWTTLLDDQIVPLVQAGRIEEARAVLGRL